MAHTEPRRHGNTTANKILRKSIS